MLIARHLRDTVLVALCLLSPQPLAQTAEAGAAGLHRRETVTIGKLAVEVAVRFDRPISHERSWLSLVHDGEVVETIHPRLGAAPNVLFARIRTPPAGDYIVRWVVCPEGSNERYDGEFPFTVGGVAAITPEDPR